MSRTVTACLRSQRRCSAVAARQEPFCAWRCLLCISTHGGDALASWPGRALTPAIAAPSTAPPPQGLWQDVFTSWLGGVRDPLLISDPDALLRPDQPLLGTLAGGLLPAFFVAPSAAVLTGALEGYWQFFCLSLRDASAK